jgi:hypothetical protein
LVFFFLFFFLFVVVIEVVCVLLLVFLSPALPSGFVLLLESPGHVCLHRLLLFLQESAEEGENLLVLLFSLGLLLT